MISRRRIEQLVVIALLGLLGGRLSGRAAAVPLGLARDRLRSVPEVDWRFREPAARSGAGCFFWPDARAAEASCASVETSRIKPA
jgi:hypothetical protein